MHDFEEVAFQASPAEQSLASQSPPTNPNPTAVAQLHADAFWPLLQQHLWSDPWTRLCLTFFIFMIVLALSSVSLTVSLFSMVVTYSLGTAKQLRPHGFINFSIFGSVLSILNVALTFAADTAASYGLRRALLEGCLMALTMVLDAQSTEAVTALAHEHLLKGAGNSRSVFSREPPPPQFSSVKFSPFYLQHGTLAPDPVDNYIMTPSGPTSSGKTSVVEYFCQANCTPVYSTETLVFKDGILVRALREGHWLVLDELNLAPAEVLEALNRLLDDNQELVIPESQDVVVPHEAFYAFCDLKSSGLVRGKESFIPSFP
ncbi:hypothetical protein C8J56DRAFT_1138072 [Mycena floridula]|nr:hypothetical protein C8J56DRAFT_1139222 [Mycena floridula]KAJ7572866.1 hypothetical protein C8J56DRAFT_1138072 [Mycena floridula]